MKGVTTDAPHVVVDTASLRFRSSDAETNLLVRSIRRSRGGGRDGGKGTDLISECDTTLDFLKKFQGTYQRQQYQQ